MSILKIDKPLLHSRKMASDILHKMQNTTYESPSKLHEDLYPFILYKLLLYDSAYGNHNINELMELSVAKAIQLDKKDAFKADSAASCDGATSAMNKKILLYMAIQKGFDIKLPVERTAYFETTDQIAEALFQAITSSDGG